MTSQKSTSSNLLWRTNTMLLCASLATCTPSASETAPLVSPAQSTVPEPVQELVVDASSDDAEGEAPSAHLVDASTARDACLHALALFDADGLTFGSSALRHFANEDAETWQVDEDMLDEVSFELLQTSPKRFQCQPLHSGDTSILRILDDDGSLLVGARKLEQDTFLVFPLFRTDDSVHSDELVRVSQVDQRDNVLLIETESLIAASSCTEDVSWLVHLRAMTTCDTTADQPQCMGRFPLHVTDREERSERQDVTLLHQFEATLQLRPDGVVYRLVEGEGPPSLLALEGSHAFGSMTTVSWSLADEE